MVVLVPVAEFQITISFGLSVVAPATAGVLLLAAMMMIMAATAVGNLFEKNDCTMPLAGPSALR